MKLTPSKIRQAVLNNALWCDAICRAHGGETTLTEHVWFNRRNSPPFYPNVDTLTQAGIDAQMETIRADGRPHVAPIWFALDGEALFFTTWHTTVKAANLKRDPRVCLVVDDEMPPFAFVQYEGVAHFVEDPAALLHWATIIGGRYMGADKAEAFGKRNSVFHLSDVCWRQFFFLLGKRPPQFHLLHKIQFPCLSENLIHLDRFAPASDARFSDPNRFKLAT